MADDQPSRETPERISERLDTLELLLRSNSARLTAVERRLGLDWRAAVPPELRAPGEQAGAEPPRAEPESAPPRRGVAPEAGAERRVAEEAAPSRERHEPDGGREAFRAGVGGWAAAGREFASDAGTTDGEAAASAAGNGAGGVAAGAEAGARATGPGSESPRDFESLVGGSWFNWLGILAVALGVGFFLKLAFENEWIGPAARVAMGAGVGLALLVVGERLRGRGLRQYAYVLSGGGVLILYLSIYAAFNFYRLVGQPAAFLLMAGMTACAVLLSVRLDALPVAVLGLIGGFLTPVMLSTGRDNQAALFTYVALLDAGVLAVAYFKRWNSLNFLSFAATALMTLGWLVTHYRDEKLWTTLFFLSLFFFLYSMLAVVHNLLPRRPARWFDAALVSANASFHCGLGYLLLIDAGHGRRLPATAAVVVSAFFVLLFYAAWRLNRAERLLSYVYVGAAVTFFTAALGIQYELYWVTAVWAVEGLMLTWVGLRAGEPAARRAGLVVFALAALHWLAWDLPDTSLRAGADFVPLLNRRALSGAALVAALAVAAWLYRRGGRAGEVTDEERAAASSSLALAGHALAVTLLTFDLGDYFSRRRVLASDADARGRADHARMFSLTALWAVYGAGLLTYGARRGRRVLRYAGVLLVAAATIAALAGVLPYYAAPWHAPVFNPTFAAFALLVAVYFHAARLYAKDEALPAEERSAVPLLVVAANLLAVVALSAEASGYFEAQIAAARAQLPDPPLFETTYEDYRAAQAEYARASRPVRDLELAKQLSLSIVWALYGAGLLLVGRLRRARLLRLLALALLGLTTLKVFVWDLSSLDRVYRIISFIALGLVLLAVSYLYQRGQQQQQQRAAGRRGDGGQEIPNQENFR